MSIKINRLKLRMPAGISARPEAFDKDIAHGLTQHDPGAIPQQTDHLQLRLATQSRKYVRTSDRRGGPLAAQSGGKADGGQYRPHTQPAGSAGTQSGSDERCLLLNPRQRGYQRAGAQRHPVRPPTGGGHRRGQDQQRLPFPVLRHPRD